MTPASRIKDAFVCGGMTTGAAGNGVVIGKLDRTTRPEDSSVNSIAGNESGTIHQYESPPFVAATGALPCG